MEANGSAAASDSPPVALLLQNGRLRGTHTPLTNPITTVGRAEGCDLRLNLEAIAPFQCVLACGPTGLILRNLLADEHTQVNGQVVTFALLRDGDQLTIGPCQFQVQLPAPAAGPAPTDPEREALRIQAAAVAAQQAAVMEEEIRLQQRRVALEQQEQQLAKHLEEKRQRLLSVRAEVRAAHADLRKTRSAYETRVAQILHELAQSRQELTEGQQQLLSERQHLLELRQRLKRRFHRHWAHERNLVRQREAEFAQQQHHLEQKTHHLQREQAELVQARLSFNGDLELGRRQLQAEREELRREQAALQERELTLDQREATLRQRETVLQQDNRQWEAARHRLQEEVRGLENRIVNGRRKLVEQQEGQRHPEPIRTLANLPARPAIVRPEPPWQADDGSAQPDAVEFRGRLTLLQQLAGEVADQRLCLAEQYELLLQAKEQWQHQRVDLAKELETQGEQLHQREEAVRLREQGQETAERALQERIRESIRQQQHLEGRSAQLVAAAASTVGERERLLEEVRLREESVQQQLAALDAVRERWTERRRRQSAWLRSQRDLGIELRQRAEELRQEWLERLTGLDKERRNLAERALALEQYRQRWIARASHPKVAEKRLERLRRRWAALGAATERTLSRERKHLQTQLAQLADQLRQLQQDADALAHRDVELSAQQAAWEKQQLQDHTEQEKLRRELQSLRQQRQSQEQQSAALREEVERLARLLLDDDHLHPFPVVQAA